MRGIIVVCFALLFAVEPQPKKSKKSFKKIFNCIKRDKKKEKRPVVLSSPLLTPQVLNVPTYESRDVSSPSSSDGYYTALSDVEQNRVSSQNVIENLVQTSAIEFDRQSLSQRQQRSPSVSLRRPSRDRSPTSRRRSQESLNGEKRSLHGSQSGSPKKLRRPSNTLLNIFEPQPEPSRPPTPPVFPAVLDMPPAVVDASHNHYPALVPPEAPEPEPEQSSSAGKTSFFGKVGKFAQGLDPRRWFAAEQKEVELVKLPAEAEKDAGFFTRSWYWVKNMFRNIPVGLAGTVQYFVDFFRERTIHSVHEKVVAKVLEDPGTIAKAHQNYLKGVEKQNNIVANYQRNTNERLKVFEENH